ncbi:MAG: DUF2569 family protein [Alphaproteobacteria bacterium]|nr:DUF2569 family protein [Alphaproteobacteria bacterium]MBV8407477.1 DUF2569 family protein [Alphaproteobacteria bacterium]
MADVATASSSSVVTGPKGLGGWLILLMLGQFGSIVRVGKAAVDDLNLFQQTDRVGAVSAEVALNLLLLAFIIYVAVAMLRTKRSFPTLWIWQGVAAILVPWIDILMVAALLGVGPGQLVDSSDLAHTVGAVIAVGLWSWYLQVSVRVKNTFVN